MHRTQLNDYPKISLDYLAGLITVGGSFMWLKNGNRNMPAFQMKMQASEKPIFILIKERLGLKERIYEYTHQNRHYVLLVIRRRSILENIIIPALEFRLFGPKKEQFEAWKKKMFHVKHFSYK